jgi:hypothetical protein
MGLLLYVPPLSKALSFNSLSALELALCLAAGLTSTAWFEVWKLARRRRHSRLQTAQPLAVAGA